MCCDLEEQRDTVLGQKGKNVLQKEATCEGTEVQLECSEWGSEGGDEAAETSTNPITQGHARVLCLVIRLMGISGEIFFSKKRSLRHWCGNDSIHQWFCRN